MDQHGSTWISFKCQTITFWSQTVEAKKGHGSSHWMQIGSQICQHARPRQQVEPFFKNAESNQHNITKSHSHSIYSSYIPIFPHIPHIFPTYSIDHSPHIPLGRFSVIRIQPAPRARSWRHWQRPGMARSQRRRASRSRW